MDFSPRPTNGCGDRVVDRQLADEPTRFPIREDMLFFSEYKEYFRRRFSQFASWVGRIATLGATNPTAKHRASKD